MERPKAVKGIRIPIAMIYVGPISSIFDIITYLVMWYVFSCNSPEHQTLFQTGWFVEGLLSQTLIVHMIRTRKIPFIQSRATWPVMPSLDTAPYIQYQNVQGFASSEGFRN